MKTYLPMAVVLALISQSAFAMSKHCPTDIPVDAGQVKVIELAAVLAQKSGKSVLDIVSKQDAPGKTSTINLIVFQECVELLKHFNRTTTGKFLNEKAGNVAGTKGLTPLHVAISRNNPEIVKLLLEAGANPRVKVDSFITAFKSAEGKLSLHTFENDDAYTVAHELGLEEIAAEIRGHLPTWYRWLKWI